MSNSIILKKKLGNFNKKIKVSGDKSLSIRWVLFSSIAKGKSKAFNLLLSEDVLAAKKCVTKYFQGSYGVRCKCESHLPERTESKIAQTG